MKNLEIANVEIGARTIGLEFENPLIHFDGRAIDFPTIQKVWRHFIKEGGWTPKNDSLLPNIIDGVFKKFGEVSVSIIPDSGAGNFEVAFSPMQNLDEAKDAYKLVYDELITHLKKLKLTLIGYAVQPGELPPMDTFRRRNALYETWSKMESYDLAASLTSSPISAHQVGIGMSPTEFVERTNAMMAISGLIFSLCGNAPIQNWQILQMKDVRLICMHFLRFIVNAPGYDHLVGFPPKPFRSIADFYRYYWSGGGMILPLLRDGQWLIPDKKINFVDFLHSAGIDAHTVQNVSKKIVPAIEDVNWGSVQLWPYAKPHITLDETKASLSEFLQHFDNDSLETYFDGRLTNCYLECRAGSTAPQGEEMAIPALSLGLMNNFSKLKLFTEKFQWSEWEDLVVYGAICGFEAMIGGKNIMPLLQELYSIAEEGLEMRQLGEEVYLKPMQRRIELRKNPADLALESFRKSKEDFLSLIRY